MRPEIQPPAAPPHRNPARKPERAPFSPPPNTSWKNTTSAFSALNRSAIPCQSLLSRGPAPLRFHVTIVSGPRQEGGGGSCLGSPSPVPTHDVSSVVRARFGEEPPPPPPPPHFSGVPSARDPSFVATPSAPPGLSTLLSTSRFRVTPRQVPWLLGPSPPPPLLAPRDTAHLAAWTSASPPMPPPVPPP